jgi:hypothetical protein
MPGKTKCKFKKFLFQIFKKKFHLISKYDMTQKYAYYDIITEKEEREKD